MTSHERRNFRLPKDVRPVRYEVRWDLDLERWTFGGRSRVLVRLARPSHELELHAVDLSIAGVRAVRDGESLAARRVDVDAEAENVRLAFDAPLAAGEWTLELEFTGAIREDLAGLYRSTRPNERYAATQFEAADARKAMPCFDEPEFKARFVVELVHPTGLAALANMPIERQQDLGGGRTLTRFEETPPISSYLVAFTVGPYEATPEARTRTGWPVRVWLPKGMAALGEYARDAHARALERLEAYTAIPYPYRKVDAIGIPDFSAGAMENPGAITYRVRVLTAAPGRAPTATLRAAFDTIAHELTHMWWGDLVTMAWWDDLWLNESFATCIGEKVTRELNPDWRTARDEVLSVQNAFSLDSLATTHPISVEAKSVHEAEQRFDAITYEKGSAVLRMIERYLGADTFRVGVRIYLNRHAESNATRDDFWRALDEASGQDVTRLATAWITEPGHPLVGCRLEEVRGGLRLHLRQRRFFADPDARDTGQRWPIPMILRCGSDAGATERRFLFDAESATIDLPGVHWLFPNAGAAGFYRFALDADALPRLLDAVRQLPAEERALLVGNQWALLRAGAAATVQYLAVLAALRGEDDRAVLEQIALSDTRGQTGLAWLSAHAVPDHLRERFARVIEATFRPVLERRGWDARDGEAEEERQKRALAIAVLGKHARAADVRREARRRLERYLAGEADLDPDLASAVSIVAAGDGDAELQARYVARMREAAARDPQEETRFRQGLAHFEDQGAIERTLGACLDGTIRDQDLPLLLIVVFANRFARAQALAAVRENWETRFAKLEGSLRRFVIGSLAQCTAPHLAQEVPAFLTGAPAAPDTTEQIARTLERLRLDAAAARRIGDELEGALAGERAGVR